MSVIGEAETAIETATGAGWLRITLRLLPYALIAVLAIALLQTRARLHDVRQADALAAAESARQEAERTASNAERLATAADGYARRTAALKPLIITSHDTVDRYAETPAGHAPCRDAERVRQIDDLDASLADPAPAGVGDRTVPAEPAAPPGGR